MERPHCHAENLSGVPVRVTGSSPLTDTDRHFLDVIARAVQARFTKENPMKYRIKPRNVDAAQWSLAKPGDVIGLLANHNTDSRREGDQLVFNDGYREAAADPTDWVVIDEGEAYVYADTRFRDLFEARALRGGPLVG